MPVSPDAKIEISAFNWVPDFARGLVRDMRLRWAMEEVGKPYDVRLLSFKAMKQPDHLALNPFGQIPTYEEDDLALFESGAIVLHIAEQHPGLLPEDANGRARAVMWMFAAVATVEPPIVERSMAVIAERDKPWYAERLPMLDDRVRARLGELTRHLGEDEWLDGAFSAGMLADYLDALAAEGPAVYRRLFWEAGAIGQVLYLEAEAAGVRATGIGCFFDDPVHALVGLQDREWQSLYHFTVGGPVEDARLSTLPAYPDHPDA